MCAGRGGVSLSRTPVRTLGAPLSTSRFSSLNTAGVSREEWGFAAVGLLLVIDLLALPWFSITVGPFSASLTASDAPDGWLAILGVLAVIAAVADLGLERFSPSTALPAIGGSRAQTRLVLAGVAALMVALKFLFHIHLSLFGFGFWGAVVLTVAFVVLARRLR
jgi:hypothetical protein